MAELLWIAEISDLSAGTASAQAGLVRRKEICLDTATEGSPGIVADFLPEEIQSRSQTANATSSESWLTPGRFALLLGFIIAALFPHIIFGNETFFYRDYAAFGYPLAKYHRDCFWGGELPVWNALNSCGLPYLAQWNTMTLYPLSLIYLLLPLPWSLSFFCLGHLFLAGLGMYFLAHSWTKNYLAAAVAGSAFAFNGLTLQCLMWPNNIAGLALMPWVILAAQRASQEGGRRIVIAALVGATQMLSGAPEIILFTWLVLLLVLMTQPLRPELSRSLCLRRTGLVLALVIGLAAAQLLPFINLLAHSERDANFGASSWSMPAWGWMNLVLPLFRSSCAPTGVYFQSDQWWTSSYYPGVGVVLLALLAMRFCSARQVWPLWALAAFALIMALGEKGGLYSWICKTVPLLGFMRFPIKFVVLPICIFPLLAAMAVAGIRAETANNAVKAVRTWRWTLITAGIIVVLISAGVLFSYWHPFPRLRWSDVLQNGLLRIVFLTLLVGILALLKGNGRLQPWLQSAAVFCLVLDGWTHMPNQNPAVNSALFEPGFVARELGRLSLPPRGRAMVSKQTHDLPYKRMITDHTQDFLGRRAGLFGNLNLLEGISTSDGFYSLYFPEQRQIWSKLFFAPVTNFPVGLANFVGISAITTNLFEWHSCPSAQPLVTVGARPVFVDPQEILSRMGEVDFDPRQIVYLPLEAKPFLSVTNRTAGLIRNTEYRSGHIVADVEASEPVLMVVAESYYDGWQAFVDKKPVKIWRANHAFQAIEVPAGHRHVEFVYKEKYLFAGNLISGSTLLCCLIGWFRGFRSRRDEGDRLCHAKEESRELAQ